MTREAGPTGAWLFQALVLDAMTIYTGKSDSVAALRIELTDVLYVPRIWHDVPSSVARRTYLGR
jgi:hypothetical protein